MGVATFAQGTMGALGSANKAKARNQAAIRDYKYQLAQREANWYQSLSVWGAKKNKYQNEINENDLAAQRGYSQAQVGLNNMFAQAAQRNEGALIKYLQSHGKMAAAGRTGRSVARISSLELGALERQAGRNLYHTGPIALRGGIGTALQHELGLYPTSRAKDMQENVGRVLPKPIGDALDRLDKHISKARKKKIKPSGF